MELQATRVLAYKLYGQCRDSSSGIYKLLTPSIRTLRNVLEEVEESVDNTEVPTPYEPHIAEQVAKSNSILAELDLALQRQGVSSDRKQPSQNSIADLKTAVDVACHDLTIAHLALSNNGEIQLRLDIEGWTPMRLPSSKSGSSDAARKLSTSSSAWSLVTPESGGDGSATGSFGSVASPAGKQFPGDEKQVCSHTIGTGPARNPSSWASTFALDPLSMSMDEATAFLLSDDTPETCNHTELGPDSTVITLGKLNDSLINPNPFANDHTGSRDAHVQLEDTASRSTAPLPAATEVALPESSTLHQSVHEVGAVRSPTAAEEQPALLKEEALPDDQSRQQRSMSGDTLHAEDQDIGNAVGLNSSTIGNNHASSAPPASPQLRVHAMLPDDDNGARKSSTEIESVDKSGLKPPLRAPPPPPSPRWRRARIASVRRYIVTNPTPENDENSEDSDEDLYTTSRPASPTRKVEGRGSRQVGPSGGIPEVRVDGSACDEVHQEQKTTASNSAQAIPTKQTHPVTSNAQGAPPNCNDVLASCCTVLLENEVPIDLPLRLDQEPKPPPLPKRPARYRSLRSASAAPYAALAPLAPAIRPEAGRDTASRLRVDQEPYGLKHRKSVDEVLNLVPADESSKGRWSWRSRSRSELDPTQMRVATLHRRSHSNIVKLIQEDLGPAARSRFSLKSNDAPPQLLDARDRPPPVPPRSRLSGHHRP